MKRTVKCLASVWGVAALALGMQLAHAQVPGIARQAQPVSAFASSPERLLEAGRQALRAIDEGRIEPLWKSAPAYVRTLLPEAQFVSDIKAARSSVGTVAGRDWAGIERVRYTNVQATIPPGVYANLVYGADLADGGIAFERLSFRLEDDGWHLTGYNARVGKN